MGAGAVDQHGKHDRPRARQLERVADIPGRNAAALGGALPGRDPRLLAGEEAARAESGGAAIELARYRAECREVAIDKAGVEFSRAKAGTPSPDPGHIAAPRPRVRPAAPRFAPSAASRRRRCGTAIRRDRDP